MNIIGTDMVLEVGKVYDDHNCGFKSLPFSSDSETVSQRFLVLREVTAEEFISSYISNGGNKLGAAFICRDSTHFYEISMD